MAGADMGTNGGVTKENPPLPCAGDRAGNAKIGLEDSGLLSRVGILMGSGAKDRNLKLKMTAGSPSTERWQPRGQPGGESPALAQLCKRTI